MTLVRSFPFFACARFLKFQKMATTIGAKEEKAKENGMMNSLSSVSKMRMIKTGVIMEVLGFMWNDESKVSLAEENGWHV